MPKDIKAEFGRLMRLSRDAKGMSRATLAMRLGISPKTIQSWEMGRTFIERLDLIPQLEAELECSLSTLIAKATGAIVSGSVPVGTGTSGSLSPQVDAGVTFEGHQMGMASQQRLMTRPGPLSPKFNLTSAAAVAMDNEVEKFEAEWVSVPMLKPSAVLNPIFEIQPKDIIRQVIIPQEWVPRAGVLVAVRMGDSAMMPMIPLGAIVIIDLRPLPLEKALGKITALEFAGKGLRIRQVKRDMAGERYYGASITEYGRAQIQIRPNRGDKVLGEIIGILASVC
ncbi:MAG: helix-turn-helix domain-containing protein [Planctomycetaceae bacterium]|nr:helix-turn-helix domain-containing protein [Planctomycetaceae bacterium]